MVKTQNRVLEGEIKIECIPNTVRNVKGVESRRRIVIERKNRLGLRPITIVT